MAGNDAPLDLALMPTPTWSPDATRSLLYAKSDGLVYVKGSDGVEHKVGEISANSITGAMIADGSVTAVDLAAGLNADYSVRVCDTGTSNPATAAPNSVDGITLAVGDRVLRVGVGGAPTNGIWVVQTLGTGANGVWVRPPEADTSAELAGVEVAVREGTARGGSRWVTGFKASDVLGTADMWWFPASLDLGAVHKTGDESIAGVKKFTDPPWLEEEAASPAAPADGARFFTRAGRMWARTPSSEYMLAIDTQAANLIANGSFELPSGAGVLPTNWNGFWRGGTGTTYTDTAQYTAGLQSCRIDNSAANSDNIVLQSDVFSIPGGGTLLLEFDCRIDAAGAQISIEFQTSVDTTGGAPNFFATGTYVTGAAAVTYPGNNGWQHITRAISIPAGHFYARLCLRQTHVGSDAIAHSVWVDAVTARIDPTAAPDAQWTKVECKVCMTTNVNVANPGTAIFDGQTLANADRLLLVGQTAGAENGIYLFQGSSAPMIRAGDADTPAELAGAQVAVTIGTYGGTRWGTSFKATDIVGTTVMNWSQGTGDTLEFINLTMPGNATGQGLVPFTVNSGSQGMTTDGAGRIVVQKAGAYYVEVDLTGNSTAAGGGWIITTLKHWRGATEQSRRETVQQTGAVSTAGFDVGVVSGVYNAQVGDLFEVLWSTSGNNLIDGRSHFNAHRIAGPGPKGDKGDTGPAGLTVRAVAGTNITLSGTQTIDGVALVANDWVLAASQTLGKDNGVWVVGPTAWVRPAALDAALELAAAEVGVQEGTVYGGTRWTCGMKATDVVGTTAQLWRSSTQGDTGWIAPTLQNGWRNYGGNWETCAYRRINGVVYLRGLISAGTATSGTLIFQLPVGFRPGGDQHNPVASNATYGQINIMANGVVQCNAPLSSVWVSLQVAPFPADN